MLVRFLFLTILSVALPSNQYDQGKEFDQLLEKFYQEGLQLNPLAATVFNSDNRYADQFEITISDEYRQNFRAYYQKCAEALNGFNKKDLNSDQKISYEILRWECQVSLEGLKYPDYLTPINQFWSLPFMVNQQASGTGAVPFKTLEDYNNWLKRMEGFTAWIDLAIERMREGIEKKYVLPRILVEKMIPQYTALSAGAVKDHLYYGPIRNLPEDFSESEKTQITEAYEQTIQNKIIPAFARLQKFLQETYLAKARGSYGLSDLPNGLDYYNYLIKVQTTTSLTADEIHKIGLSEVKRIRTKMMTIKDQVGFEGTLLEFFDYVKNKDELMPFKTPEEVLKNFEAIHQKMEPQLKEQFNVDIKIPFEIGKVPAYLEASASPYYVPGAQDGSRPGIFYVPIPDASKYNTYSDESLFLHEAIPGHHFQASVAVENTNTPKFRKYLWYGAYGEGWGLYAESLGKELGLFQDPYQEFGMLGLEMHRAIRLVVDTGIHAKGWTREEAIDYSLDNEAFSKEIVTSEVERYMAWPAQALSYKIGQLKIQELRLIAEKKLGKRFNIQEFHNVILNTGAAPLKILEENIKNWVDTGAEP